MKTQKCLKIKRRTELLKILYKSTFITCLILFNYGTFGQINWQKAYSKYGRVNIAGSSQTKDGIVILAASDSNYSNWDLWLYKIDKKGNKIWDRKFKTSDQEYWDAGSKNNIIQTRDNGFLLGCYSNSNNSGDKTHNSYGDLDGWLIKTDSNGNKIWDKTFGGNKGDGISSLLEITSGYLIGGISNSDSGSGNVTVKNNSLNNSSDIWLFKIDNNGNILWQKMYGGHFVEVLNSIITINSNKYILCGKTLSDSGGSVSQVGKGGSDFWFVCIDSNGNKIWDKRYGGNNMDDMNSAAFNGKLIVAVGSSKSSQNGDITKNSSNNSSHCWLIAIDTNGNKIWDNLLNGDGEDDGFDVKFYKNQLYIAITSSSNAGSDKSENSRGGRDYWVVKLDTNGQRKWDRTFGGSENDEVTQLEINEHGEIILIGTSNSNISGDRRVPRNSIYALLDILIVSIDEPKSLITGNVYSDFNFNCKYNKQTEYNIPNITIYNKTENTYAITNDSIYAIYLYDSTKAVLSVINLDSNLYVACGKDSITLDMTGKTDTSGIDFPILSSKTGYCINITSFSSELQRPGRWTSYQLSYQNNAFDAVYNAFIEIEIDTTKIDSIKSPHSFTLVGNILKFQIGFLRPFGHGSLSYSIKLKTSVIIGTSHCHRAYVYPICNLYPSTNYDSSVIQPMMRCLLNDTIEFSLKNIGAKDQKDWGLVKSYEDVIMFKVDSFKLNKGDIRTWRYKLDLNKVYTAEVFNSNHHPVTPILIRHNDLCANRRPMIPENAALSFSRRDETKEYEEACVIIRGSYDPNIKSVQPVGMFAEHYTSTGTELKYRIDFQNTGTDTAFRVVLVDTLSSFLNIASFVPGVSSHPYSIEFGGRAVKFIFDPIRLVDSFHNEQESHGYVHFKIKHISGISPKTKIENKADIYFDYNAPVRTNTVFNTIFDTIQIYVPKAGDTSKGEDTTNSIQAVNQTSILVFPNPTTDKFFIQMSEPVTELSIDIYDMQGRFIKSVSSANNQTVEVSAQGMTKGIYHIRCMSGEKLIVVKKVMVQ